MWGAATYDQHHSSDPLAQRGGAPAPRPSLAFTDFSPEGPHRDCILGVAAESGLSWGAQGWTAADPSRPTGADALSPMDVDRWRGRMTALLSRVSGEWHDRCERPDLPPPPVRSPEPEIDVSGHYEVISGNLNTCDVLDSRSVTSFSVARSGDGLTIAFDGTKQKAAGTISHDLSFKVTYHLEVAEGFDVDVEGHFGAGTGGDVLLRDGLLVPRNVGSERNCPFEAKKPGS